MPVVLALLLILLVVILNKFYNFVFGKPLANAPPVYFITGLPRFPIWGSYWLLLWGNYNFPHKTIHYYAKKYKSKVVGCWLGDYYTIVATNYNSIKELLTKKEYDGRLTDAFIFTSRAFGKKLGIFFTDGDKWREQRRFALRYMREFGFGRRMDKTESDFAEELGVLLDTLKSGPANENERKVLKDGSMVRFPDILYPTAANFFLTIFTGERLPRTDHEKLRVVSRAAAKFQRNSDTTGGAILVTPWIRHFAHGFSYPGFIEGSTGITNFIKKRFGTNEASFIGDAERGFLDTCIKRLKDEEGFPTITEEQVLMLGTDLIFPALTANPWAVTIIIKYMMHHPHIMEKVQKQIDTVIGRDRLITLNDRVNLPYVEATIREVMRVETMTPWSVAHRATERGTLDGFDVPKNAVLVTDLYSMHHDPEMWGDPEEVRPERFLTEDGHMGKDRSLPFGAGGRLCAGETFARQFLFLTFSTLVQNFDFSFIEGEPSSLEDRIPGFATSPKDFWARVTPRK
ncbi:probable cytochrome P450 304a1 isoform X1 [Neodiprion pinetum]|uniref:probable cytochrome P450 304a1 isoform X1 n=1 Tax=Neodiprion pinetum TaxID=441929 RepID=UPI00371C6BE5